METIEMDLMQAQIGELTAELTRLSNKFSNGGGTGGKIAIVTMEDITWSSNKFIATYPSWSDFTDKLVNNDLVLLKANTTMMTLDVTLTAMVTEYRTTSDGPDSPISAASIIGTTLGNYYMTITATHIDDAVQFNGELTAITE